MKRYVFLFLLLMCANNSFAVQEQVKYMGARKFKCGQAEVVERQSSQLSGYFAAFLSRFMLDTPKSHSPVWSCKLPEKKLKEESEVLRWAFVELK